MTGLHSFKLPAVRRTQLITECPKIHVHLLQWIHRGKQQQHIRIIINHYSFCDSTHLFRAKSKSKFLNYLSHENCQNDFRYHQMTIYYVPKMSCPFFIVYILTISKWTILLGHTVYWLARKMLLFYLKANYSL